MALTLTRRRAPQPPARRAPRNSGPRRDAALDGLSVADRYFLALHGADIPGLGPSALTAAGLDVTAKNAMDIRRLVQPWQARSMSYFDLVPEVKFAARFMGALLSRVRLFPAMLDEETQEPEEITDKGDPVYQAFARIQDRNGARAQLQKSYGMQKWLIGETYLTVSPDHDRGEVWECLSPNELRVQPGGIATRFRAPMLSADQYKIGEISDEVAPEKYVIGNDAATIRENGGTPLGPSFEENGPDVIVVYRLWRQHPAYSWLADSNMMACLDLLEELVLSTYSVRAQLKSRLNQAGMLVWPEESSFPSVGNNPDEDPNSDLFQQRLTQMIMQAIGDPGSSAAFAPFIANVAGEFIKDIKLIKFSDSQGDLAEISQRTEMVERYGVGAELPPELFKSQTDLNHWTGWLVDEQTWRSYGHPAALEMADDLNACYLQPAIRDNSTGVDWTKVCIGIDPAEVITHPNRAKDAADAFDRLQISGKVYREVIGFNDNDAMSAEEKDERAGIEIHDGSLYKYGIPAVRANIEPSAGEVESAPGPGGDVANPSTGGPNQPGPPKEKVSPAPSSKEPNPGADAAGGGPAVTGSAGDERVYQLLATCQAAVHRGREMAGARLRSMTGKRGAGCAQCQEAIADVQNWDVAHTLGDGQIADLFGSPQATELVAGTGEWLAAMLEGMGVTRPRAIEAGSLVERHTAGTLYQSVADGLPSGFVRFVSRLHLPSEQA